MTEFLAPLIALSGMSQEWLHGAFLVFLRVGAAMALMPGFGEQVVPMRVRLALTLAFTAITLPAVADRIGVGNPVLLGAAEVAAGLIIGIGMRLFILALQTAGAIAAQATSLAQLFAGAGAEPQPAIGHVLTISGLALAMAMGLHVKAAELLITSYDLLPSGQMPASNEAAAWGTAAVARCFALAFSLAAPFVLASVIYNLALGAINKAMPALMVSFIGAPALTAGGLVLLALAIAPVLVIWQGAFEAYLAAPFGPAR